MNDDGCFTEGGFAIRVKDKYEPQDRDAVWRPRSEKAIHQLRIGGSLRRRTAT